MGAWIMMQWTKGDVGFEAKVAAPVTEMTPEAPMGPSLLFAQVLQSLAMALSRVGVTSLMLVIMVAAVVATVVFGLTANEAAAVGGWCRC
jgi:hypothetical protein